MRNGVAFFKQFRALGLRQMQALRLPPLRNGGVVAAEQHLGHAPALPGFGPGVMRAVKQSAQRRIEAVLRVAVVKWTGYSAGWVAAPQAGLAV